jgi:HD-like signal output (HDOD) protein
MGRESTLDKYDGLRDFVAEKWMSGCTNEEVAEKVAERFDIDKPAIRTIQNWRQDEQVAEKIHAVMRERIARVVRKTDSAIDQLDFSQLTVDEIIKIRREFLPERDALTDEKTDATKTAEDLFGAMEDDPEFAAKVAQAAAADE